MRLLEGMRPNDLKGLLNNTISVDEYESKIDDTALVLAFSVADRYAAEDTNRFIQKSYVEILDAEVSSAPDQKGNYYIFVELPLSRKSPKAISDLCYELSLLGGIQSWVLSIRGQELTTVDSYREIESMLVTKVDELLRDILEPAKPTMESLEQVSIADGRISFSLHDTGEYDSVFHRNGLNETAIDVSYEATKLCEQVNRALGEAWRVHKMGDHYAAYTDNHMLLFSNVQIRQMT